MLRRSQLAKASDEVQRDRELQSLRDENKILKQKYNIVNRELKQTIKQSEILNKLQHQVAKDKLKILKPSGESTAMMIVSDIHVEEDVDPLTINGLNSYNLEIASKRMKSCFERTHMLIEVLRGLTKIDSLVISILGDTITGFIHDELVETNNLSPTEASIFVMDHLIQGIKFLKREGKYKEIIIPTAIGNHGRTTKDRRCATAYANSYEWLMYKTMERLMCDEPTVKFKIGNGYFNWLNVQGYDIRLHHGDNIRYQGGVGTISIPVSKAIAQWNKIQVADYDYFGHYHQFVNYNRWCCNGSMIGYNAYALSIKAEYEVPSQTLSIINKQRGKIFTDKVFCD